MENHVLGQDQTQAQRAQHAQTAPQPDSLATAPSRPRLGIMFDCDGTLLDTSAVWYQIETELTARSGHVFSTADHALIATFTMREEAAWIHETLGLGTSVDEVYVDLLAALEDGYTHHAQPRNGMVDLLGNLARAGIPCCVVSSSPAIPIDRALTCLKVRETFAAIISSDRAPHTKRDAAIYHEAAALLGTPPANTWLIDDSAYALKAARTAGYRTVGIIDANKKAQASRIREELAPWCDFVIDELTELDIAELERKSGLLFQ